MRIYHGATSPNFIERAAETAPSHTHGYCWTPQKMTPHDTPYILDNGAFSAFKNSRPWDVDAFVGRLSQLDSMPREPDFVVLPDVVTNPSQTKERAAQWAGIIDRPTAMPAQDGMDPEETVQFCDRVDAGTIFVGGTMEWKRRYGQAFVETAHDHGLRCHIARPGTVGWPESIGADSCDTASMAIDSDVTPLRALEEQQRFSTS